MDTVKINIPQDYAHHWPLHPSRQSMHANELGFFSYLSFAGLTKCGSSQKVGCHDAGSSSILDCCQQFLHSHEVDQRLLCLDYIHL